MAVGQAYQVIPVYQPPANTLYTNVIVAQSGSLIMPASCIGDDPSQTGTQAFARVLPTAPTGIEMGLVVREAQMGTQGTGLNPPAGGSGVIGYLSAIAATSPVASTVTRTPVASALTTTVLLAANAARKGARILNDTAVGFGGGSGHGAVLFITYGAAATTANPNEIIPAGGSLTLPAGYTGAVNGIWTGTVGGNAQVVEFTP